VTTNREAPATTCALVTTSPCLSRTTPEPNPLSVPIGTWIKAQGSRLGPLVAAQPGIVEIAHPERVVALFRTIRRWRDGFACWQLLFYALWHRRHILDLAPAGDVFETLSQR
jgi:asparagine synthase (glutamine-hydrolysing)